MRALAEAWRGQPELTRRIVETEAATTGQETREELARVPWFLERFREPWDAPEAATAEAINFIVRRAGGDWGNDAAFHSADHLVGPARELPDAVAGHVDGILGAILTMCAPDPGRPEASEVGTLPTAADREQKMAAALERESARIRRDGTRRRLAQAIGRSASASSVVVLAKVEALFSASTGDERHDRTVRSAMLDVLEEAVSPETLRDILPITYTALLHPDQVIRRGGIDLWVACAGVAESLPAEFSDLGVPLVEDSYVIVHRRMLEQIPRLAFPPELATKLLPLVCGWAVTYGDKPDPDILELAIWALRSLAVDLDDPGQLTAWFSVALAYVSRCRPYDRQRLLTAWWPDALRSHPAWISAALATVASPELIDYYNQRHEPVLEALMDLPQLIADVPLADIEPLSTVHGPARGEARRACRWAGGR